MAALMHRVGALRLFSPFGRERKGSSLWALFEQQSIPALQFVGAIPLVYGLGLENYGLWIYLLAVASLLGAASPGVAMAATQLISGQTEGRARAAAIHLVIFGGLLTTIVFSVVAGGVLYFVLVEFQPKALAVLPEQLPAILPVVVLNGFLMQWDIICAAALRAELKYDVSGRVDISCRAFGVIVIGILAVLNVDLLLLLYVNATLILVRATVKAHAATRGVSRTNASDMGQIFPEAVKYSLYQWVQNLSALTYSFSDRIVIGLFASSSVVAVAALAGQVAMQVHAVPRALLAPLTPALITYWTQNETERFYAAARDAWRRLWLVVALLFPTILLLGPLAVYVALNFKAPLDSIVPVILCYLVGYSIMALSIIPFLQFIGQRRLAWSGALSTGASLLNLSAALLLGHFFGVLGVAVAKAAYALPFCLAADRRLMLR